MNTFIKLPIRLVNEKMAEMMGGDAESDESFEMLDPEQIESFHPSWDKKETEDECVQVYLKSGRSFLVYMTMKQFMKSLGGQYLEIWKRSRSTLKHSLL